MRYLGLGGRFDDGCLDSIKEWMDESGAWWSVGTELSPLFNLCSLVGKRKHVVSGVVSNDLWSAPKAKTTEGL